MLKSFYRIKQLSSYDFDIKKRCERLGIPIHNKGVGFAIEEKYISIALYEYRIMDFYYKIYDWSYKFDRGLKQAIYDEMLEMDYVGLSKFVIKKNLIK